MQLGATDKALPSTAPTCNTPRTHVSTASQDLFLLFVWSGLKLTIESMQPPTLSRFMSTCTFMDPSSISTAYPSVHLLLLCLGPEAFYPSRGPPTCSKSLAGRCTHSHSCLTGTPCSQVPPEHQHRPSSHPIPLPTPSTSHSLLVQLEVC